MKTTLTRNAPQSRGFSLIEICVAVGIVATVMVALLGMLPTGLNTVNEAAVRVGDWDAPLEQSMTHWSGETGRVVGVMKDFHLHSLHSAIEPLYIFLDPDNFSYLSVKIKPFNVQGTLAHLERVFFPPGIHGCAGSFAKAQLLPDTLENEHIGVHRHADG